MVKVTTIRVSVNHSVVLRLSVRTRHVTFLTTGFAYGTFYHHNNIINMYHLLYIRYNTYSNRNHNHVSYYELNRESGKTLHYILYRLFLTRGSNFFYSFCQKKKKNRTFSCSKLYPFNLVVTENTVLFLRYTQFIFYIYKYTYLRGQRSTGKKRDESLYQFIYILIQIGTFFSPVRSRLIPRISLRLS